MPRSKKKRRSKYDMAGYNLKVKRSRAGLGLYTFDPIEKGACIIEYTGRILTPEENKTVENQYLFWISRTKTLDGSPRSNTARYINHSCRPNCEIDVYRGRIYILAKRDIKAGEELNYDYDTEFFDEWIKHNGCVCLKCKPQ
jgi:Proteins containing SET domain